MNQLRSKLILILAMFPKHWYHHNCCLCCSWCALKTQTMQNFQSPVGNKCLPSVRELSFLRSRVKLGLLVSTQSPTLCTPTKRGQIEASEVFPAEAINYVDRCGRQKFSALMLVIPKYTLGNFWME